VLESNSEKHFIAKINTKQKKCSASPEDSAAEKISDKISQQ
jgi:hypothetical protein